MEYLIGYYASKTSNTQKFKTSKPKTHSSHMVESERKRPPMVQNSYSKNSDSKGLYKSYYNCKKPSKHSNDSYHGKDSSQSSVKSKFKINSLMNSSYERPNIFSKNKTSLDYPSKYSKTIDDEDRL